MEIREEDKHDQHVDETRTTSVPRAIKSTDERRKKKIINNLTARIVGRICKAEVDAKMNKSSPSIHKVPDALRKLKECAYTPRLVSVGPLHCQDEHLKPEMQEIKNHYAYDLFTRLSGGKPDIRYNQIKECSAEMKKLREAAKKFYSQQVHKFLNEEMLVVDGCFVLEVLYRNRLLMEKSPSEESKRLPPELLDPVFGSYLTRLILRHDLMLLENQLPFPVLEKLFELTIDRLPDDLPRKTLEDYINLYWSDIMNPEFNSPLKSRTKCCSLGECIISIFNPKKSKDEDGAGTKHEEEVKHILHLLHRHYGHHYPSENIGPLKYEGKRLMPRASNLHCAGIRFVSGSDAFNIGFNSGEGPLGWFRGPRFQIPIPCTEDTESFLRNLIAFEQCCRDIPPYFTSYAYLMDALIDGAIDVEVLEKAGVKDNYLKTSDDAANLFNNLRKEVVLEMDKFCFAKICLNASNYSKRLWPRVRWWPASVGLHVKRTYLSTPWAFIGFFLGFLTTGVSIASFILIFVNV